MKDGVTNVAASVRARLFNESKRRPLDFQLILQRYAAERFLFRLGASVHRQHFVLKGALLFVVWDEAAYRPTRDVDLAGYGSNDAASLIRVFREILGVVCERDGITFAAASLKIEPIRGRAEYKGFRLRMQALLDSAVIPLQVDIGFGDAVVPSPSEVDYPVLLDAPAPRIRVYPREAAIAEKLHAMVTLGLDNSRFKDFYDVHVLSERFAFEGQTLTASVSATFSRRTSVAFAPWPAALTPSFYADPPRRVQWTRYIERSRLPETVTEFGAVGERVIAFLEPPARAVSTGAAFAAAWQPGGPWR